MAILHFRTLFGSVRPANLVQWFSMVGSVVAVSGITGLLGGSRKAQLLAAAAAFSVPMGVLQSTSTQNDYAVALWAVCLAYLVVLTKRRPLDRTETAALAGTVGLGMLTKGTFFVYATPLLFWLLVPLAVRRQLQRGVTLAAAIAVAAVTLNLGFWARNFSTYGGPYGPTDALRRSLGIVQRLIPWVGPAADSQDESPDEDARGTPVAPEARLESASSPVTGPAASPHLGAEEGSARGTPPRSVLAGVAAAAATEVRMAAWNLITPSSAVNAWIRRGMELFPSLFDEGYLVLIQRLAWNHEDTAGNPLHLSLVGLAVSILVVTRFRGFGGRCAAFALAAVSTYLLLPAVASVAAGPWGVRYQLPFFLLACPLIACGLSSLRLPRLPDVAAGLLLISAVPYMIFNNTRPIIGKTPWPTRVPSVFVASSQEILLAMVPGARGAFTSMADGVTQLHCDQVGLRIDSGDLEYAFWWLLDAPQSGTHIETLYPLDSLEGLVNRDFVPCAIICSVCGETRDTLNGLDLHIDAGVLKLYAGRGFRWE
jgi:4-amino-4-deoxy-L-arabinose transferase-like glycosyltransferase